MCGLVRTPCDMEVDELGYGEFKANAAELCRLTHVRAELNKNKSTV